MIIAFCGAFAGDQMFFQIGRRQGKRLLLRHPKWLPRVHRIRVYLERYRIPMLLGFRFMYGFRILTPLVVGVSGFRTRPFVLLNALGAALWAVVIAWVGYTFGRLVELLLGDVRTYQLWIAGGLAAISLAVWALRRRARRPTTQV